jgi:Flp pilus assembly protein TadD
MWQLLRTAFFYHFSQLPFLTLIIWVKQTNKLMKEVSAMQDLKITGQNYDFVCFRCGCIIKTGEKMVSLSVSVETPTEDGGLESIDATAISTLCSGCASVLLGQAITRDPSLMMPLAQHAEQEQAEEDLCPTSKNDENERSIPAIQEYHDGMDEADFLLALGLRFVEEKDWERAITAFTSLIELEPDNAFACDRRGIAYGRAGRYDEAIADFSRAISIDHAFAGAYNNRGLSYYKQYRFDEAIADYDTAIQLCANVAIFYANRGLAHSCKGDFYVAIADYDRAIELDPTLPETHNNRGEAYAELGQYEKALADFQYELALNPNDIVAYANRVSLRGILRNCPDHDSDGPEKGDC